MRKPPAASPPSRWGSPLKDRHGTVFGCCGQLLYYISSSHLHKPQGSPLSHEWGNWNLERKHLYIDSLRLGSEKSGREAG